MGAGFRNMRERGESGDLSYIRSEGGSISLFEASAIGRGSLVQPRAAFSAFCWCRAPTKMSRQLNGYDAGLAKRAVANDGDRRLALGSSGSSSLELQFGAPKVGSRRNHSCVTFVGVPRRGIIMAAIRKRQKVQAYFPTSRRVCTFSTQQRGKRATNGQLRDHHCAFEIAKITADGTALPATSLKFFAARNLIQFLEDFPQTLFSNPC